MVIHLGDEVDYHAISFHDSDHDGLSAGHELDKAVMEIGDGLHRLFPHMRLLESNHGSLVTRKMKHHGVPIRVVKPLHEIYETPGWTWHDELLVETNFGPIYFHHGMSSAAEGLKIVREHGVSAIQGHFHGKQSIVWLETRMRKCFAAFFGCLVDRSSYAMAYSKNNIPIYQLGAGIIDKKGLPHCIIMRLNNEGRWCGRL
jgi:hypothetical protein